MHNLIVENIKYAPIKRTKLVSKDNITDIGLHFFLDGVMYLCIMRMVEAFVMQRDVKVYLDYIWDI